MDYKKKIAKGFVVMSFYAGCFITPLVLSVIALNNCLQSASLLVKGVTSFLLGVAWGLWLSLVTEILGSVLEE
jgi:hypothetical protein